MCGNIHIFLLYLMYGSNSNDIMENEDKKC